MLGESSFISCPARSVQALFITELPVIRSFTAVGTLLIRHKRDTYIVIYSQHVYHRSRCVISAANTSFYDHCEFDSPDIGHFGFGFLQDLYEKQHSVSLICSLVSLATKS